MIFKKSVYKSEWGGGGAGKLKHGSQQSTQKLQLLLFDTQIYSHAAYDTSSTLQIF